MSITQQEPTTLERFHLALSGLGTLNKDSFGWKGKDRWVWQSSRFEESQAAISMLWAWLSEPKRNQAYNAMAQYHRIYKELGPTMLRGKLSYRAFQKERLNESV